MIENDYLIDATRKTLQKFTFPSSCFQKRKVNWKIFTLSFCSGFHVLNRFFRISRPLFTLTRRLKIQEIVLRFPTRTDTWGEKCPHRLWMDPIANGSGKPLYVVIYTVLNFFFFDFWKIDFSRKRLKSAAGILNRKLLESFQTKRKKSGELVNLFQQRP